MADFTALKTAIQTYIKQNGNEEITGNILQEVLLAMVQTMGDGAINDLVTALSNEVTARQNADGTLQANINSEATTRSNADTALGGRIDVEVTARQNADTALGNSITAINTKLAEGYVYVGIATEATNPGTPSGKVFYIATDAGTYTNFGSVEITQGINILKYNAGSWSVETVLYIDDIPAQGSAHLITSGAAYDIENNVEELNEKISGIIETKNYIEGLTFVNGRVNRDTGANQTSGVYSFCSSFIKVDTTRPLYCECDDGYQFYLAAYLNTSQNSFQGATPLTKKVKIDNPAPYYRVTYAKDPLSSSPDPSSDVTVIRLIQYPLGEEKQSYTVKKTGGDFSKLVDALDFSHQHKGLTISVGDGEWDIIDELGTAFFESYDQNSMKGCPLGNGLRLIFSEKASVVCNYNGDNSYVKSLFSPFNAAYGDFYVEGLNIKASNVRYCIHDDRSGDTVNTYHKYVNCNMVLDNRENESWNSTQCIGGGLALSSNIEIQNCIFESLLVKETNSLVSWHNASLSDAKSRVIIKDCYFKGSGTVSIFYYGSSTLMSDVIVCGNSFGAELIYGGQSGSTINNINLFAWNNEIRA